MATPRKKIYANVIHRIRTLHAKQFSIGDIARLCKVERADVRSIVDPPKPPEPLTELQLARKRLLKQVPAWWTGTDEEYKACVKSNFADVA